MDKADQCLQLTRHLLDLAGDAPDDVLALALVGAGLVLLSEADPVTAERVAGVLEEGGTQETKWF